MSHPPKSYLEMADRTKLAVGLAAGSLIAAWYRRHKRRDPWEAMLNKVLPAIVVIKVNYVKPFDGEQAGSGSATGFVVDFERGLILTNRHVIGTGPIRAEATFVNKEEVPLTPVYRDPVHDFGLFHFDVNRLKYADELQKAEIPLAEDGAKVGLEIRVVGNDSGEKIQILGGTIARLDRNAPLYGGEGFNDFNTFYYSAASNTSGGSSGSPILDQRGRAVALNAGGCNASASSYYLPLHAVVRALDALRKSETPRRATLRVVWRHVTCDEARRLALSPAAEASLRRHHWRHRDATTAAGLLCVDQVITGGSGSEAGLEPGDLLLSCGAKRFPDFDELESYLDAHVDRTVALEIERGGASLKKRPARAESLHTLTPSTFLEFGGGVLHALSLGTARSGNLDAGAGVYVAFAGFVLDVAGVPAHAVLTAVGDVATPNLEAFQAAVRVLGDGARVNVRYYAVGDRFNAQVALVRVNYRWFQLSRWCRRDPHLNEILERCANERCDSMFRACWESKKIDTCSTPATDDASTAATFQRSHVSKQANAAVSCLCKVSFDVLHAVDGVHDWHFAGCGIVVDAQRGLVATDRNTVVTALGECSVTFAASVELPAKVVFVHPTRNFAIVRYDAARFDHCAPEQRPTTACLKPRDLSVGDTLEFVGLSRTNPDQSLSQKVTVTELSCVNIAQAHVPRFRAINEEIAKFDVVLNKSLGGVFVEKDGSVSATWACYSFYSWADEKNYEAFHATGVGALLAATTAVCASIDGVPERPLRVVGFGLKRLPLSTARTSMRLDEAWVEKLQNARPGRSQVLSVAHLAHTQNGSSLVREGDLLLAVGGESTATFADVDAACASGGESIAATLWREGEVLQVDEPLERVPLGAGTERVVVWAGLLLQKPHRSVLESGEAPCQVYVSYYLYGSPGHYYGIKACRFVVEVDGKRITDLDSFLAATASVEDGAAVRLKTSDLQGQVVACTLRTDGRFFPTHEFSFRRGAWVVSKL